MKCIENIYKETFIENKEENKMVTKDYKTLEVMFRNNEPHTILVSETKEMDFKREFVEHAKKGKKFFVFEDHRGEIMVLNIAEVAALKRL